MKPQIVSIMIWAVALIFPVVFFIVIGDNLNERKPVLPFIFCPLLCIGAAALTAKINLKWLAVALVIGLAEAALLVFAV